MPPEGDLSKANLAEAKITMKQLNKARLLKEAIMPVGSKHP